MTWMIWGTLRDLGHLEIFGRFRDHHLNSLTVKGWALKSRMEEAHFECSSNASAKTWAVRWWWHCWYFFYGSNAKSTSLGLSQTGSRKMSWNILWWLSLPLWKIWVRQLGWWHSQYIEKFNMFQTTNQLDKLKNTMTNRWPINLWHTVLATQRKNPPLPSPRGHGHWPIVRWCRLGQPHILYNSIYLDSNGIILNKPLIYSLYIYNGFTY